MVSVKKFSKYYGTTLAADNVSLELKKGEITALVGANGAGKTTLLKAICAMHFPSPSLSLPSVALSADTYGKITVLGFDIVQDAEKVRALTGYAPEQPALPLDFTALEFLELTGKIRFCACGMQKNAAKTNIKNVIEQCALGDVLQKKIGALSKGYRQRLVLAASLVHNPPVLLLDEPSSGLDPAQIVQLRQTIKAISAEKTILISTHLMQEVEALCSNIHIMQNGKIILVGTKNEILKLTKQKTLDDAFLSLENSPENSMEEKSEKK
ncbi:MAG: hypothetical protein Ta2A_23420 [Treponemataceae bacterium]|nr:MAG: hypothetical protein Ta2A_23420 [Treponemataceae bacterium]